MPDIKFGIDASGARRGADQYLQQLTRIREGAIATQRILQQFGQLRVDQRALNQATQIARAQKDQAKAILDTAKAEQILANIRAQGEKGVTQARLKLYKDLKRATDDLAKSEQNLAAAQKQVDAATLKQAGQLAKIRKDEAQATLLAAQAELTLAKARNEAAKPPPVPPKPPRVVTPGGDPDIEKANAKARDLATKSDLERVKQISDAKKQAAKIDEDNIRHNLQSIQALHKAESDQRTTAIRLAKQQNAEVRNQVATGLTALRNTDAANRAYAKQLQFQISSARARGEEVKYGQILADINERLVKISPGLNQLKLQLQEIALASIRVGRALVQYVTLPLVGAATAAVKFDQEFSQVMFRTHTLAGEAAANIGRMSDAVLELAPRVGVGPVELANALLRIESVGKTGGEALDILTKSAELSAIGLGDTAKVAQSLTAAIVAYGSSNLSATQAADQLLEAVRLGGAEASEFAGILGRVVGIAQTIGVSFAEVLGFLASFTRLGIGADEAMTSLRTSLQLLTKPSQQAKAALADIGLTINEVRRMAVDIGLANTFVEIVKRSKEMKVEIGRIFPEVRSLAGVLANASERGQEYIDITKQIQQASGNTAASFEELRIEGLAAFSQLGAAFQTTLIIFARQSGLTQATRNLAENLTSLALSFNKLNPTVKETVGSLTLLLAIIPPTILAIGVLANIVNTSMVPGLVAMGAQFGPAGILLGGIVAFTLALTLLSRQTVDVAERIEELEAAGTALARLPPVQFDLSKLTLAGAVRPEIVIEPEIRPVIPKLDILMKQEIDKQFPMEILGVEVFVKPEIEVPEAITETEILTVAKFTEQMILAQTALARMKGELKNDEAELKAMSTWDHVIDQVFLLGTRYSALTTNIFLNKKGIAELTPVIESQSAQMQVSSRQASALHIKLQALESGEGELEEAVLKARAAIEEQVREIDQQAAGVAGQVRNVKISNAALEEWNENFKISQEVLKFVNAAIEAGNKNIEELTKSVIDDLLAIKRWNAELKEIEESKAFENILFENQLLREQAAAAGQSEQALRKLAIVQAEQREERRIRQLPGGPGPTGQLTEEQLARIRAVGDAIREQQRLEDQGASRANRETRFPAIEREIQAQQGLIEAMRQGEAAERLFNIESERLNTIAAANETALAAGTQAARDLADAQIRAANATAKHKEELFKLGEARDLDNMKFETEQLNKQVDAYLKGAAAVGKLAIEEAGLRKAREIQQAGGDPNDPDNLKRIALAQQAVRDQARLSNAQSLASLKQENEALERQLTALKLNEEAVKKLAVAEAGLAAAREIAAAGGDLSSDEARQRISEAQRNVVLQQQISDQQEAAQLTEKLWDNTIKNIQESFGDLFSQLASDGEKKFKSVGDFLKKFFGRLSGELVQQSISEVIINLIKPGAAQKGQPVLTPAEINAQTTQIIQQVSQQQQQIQQAQQQQNQLQQNQAQQQAQQAAEQNQATISVLQDQLTVQQQQLDALRLLVEQKEQLPAEEAQSAGAATTADQKVDPSLLQVAQDQRDAMRQLLRAVQNNLPEILDVSKDELDVLRQILDVARDQLDCCRSQKRPEGNNDRKSSTLDFSHDTLETLQRSLTFDRELSFEIPRQHREAQDMREQQVSVQKKLDFDVLEGTGQTVNAINQVSADIRDSSSAQAQQTSATSIGKSIASGIGSIFTQAFGGSAPQASGMTFTQMQGGMPSGFGIRPAGTPVGAGGMSFGGGGGGGFSFGGAAGSVLGSIGGIIQGIQQANQLIKAMNLMTDFNRTKLEALAGKIGTILGGIAGGLIAGAYTGGAGAGIGALVGGFGVGSAAIGQVQIMQQLGLVKGGTGGGISNLFESENRMQAMNRGMQLMGPIGLLVGALAYNKVNRQIGITTGATADIVRARGLEHGWDVTRQTPFGVIGALGSMTGGDVGIQLVGETLDMIKAIDQQLILHLNRREEAIIAGIELPVIAISNIRKGGQKLSAQRIQSVLGAIGIPAESAAAAGVTTDKTTIEQIDAAQALLQRRRELVDFMDSINGVAEEALDATKQLDALHSAVDRLGLEGPLLGITVGDIEEFRTKALAKMVSDFNEAVSDIIRGFTEPQALAMQKLSESQARRVREAQELGIDLVQIERVNFLERQNILKQLNEPIQSLLDQISVSTAGQSPLAALGEATQRFNEIAAGLRAETGLVTIDELTSAASTLLSLAQEFMGAPAFTAVQDTIIAALQEFIIPQTAADTALLEQIAANTAASVATDPALVATNLQALTIQTLGVSQEISAALASAGLGSTALQELGTESNVQLGTLNLEVARGNVANEGLLLRLIDENVALRAEMTILRSNLERMLTAP